MLKTLYVNNITIFTRKKLTHMKFRNLLSIFILLTVGISTLQAQKYGNITYSDAINISGKQRMLSQKITKVYMMRLNGATKNETAEEFKASTRLFNKNLMSLDDNSTNSSEKTKELIVQEKSQWEKFLNKFLLNPTDNVNKLLVLSNGLLDKCKALVSGIQSDGGSSNVNLEKLKTINLAGKQRMLSQRLSLYYLACKLNAGKPEVIPTQGELKKVFNEMEKSFASLSTNDFNTEEINKNLEIIKNEFTLITSNKSGFENQNIDTDKILAFSNKVTSTYNTITGLYAQL